MESENDSESGISETESKHHDDASHIDSNPWLLLKTITSFESEFKTKEIKHHALQQHPKSQEVSLSSHTSESNSLPCTQEDNCTCHCPKKIVEMKKSLDGENQMCVHVSKKKLVQKGNGKRFSCRGLARTRSRKAGLSEGDIISVSQGSTNPHNSTSCHRNGTVSDAGADHLHSSGADCSDDPVETLSRFSPTSLLVESLIDQLCKLMEKDTTRQKKLYHVICDRLHRMQLIDDTYTIEEFQFMRSHYQRALYQLLAVAKSSTNAPNERSIILPLPSTNINLDVKLSSEQVLEWSRYRHDYQELEYIAKGGFGHVYKVRNKLDGGEYAIKKIFLRYCYIEGFLRSLREVKMLARLNHPNIVSYKAAWLEPLDGRSKKSQGRRNSPSAFNIDPSASFSRLPLPPTSNHCQEDSSDIVFQDTSLDTDSHNSKKERKDFENNHNSEFSMHGTNQSINSFDKSKKLLSDLLGKSSIVFQPSSTYSRGKTSRAESDDSDSSGSSSEVMFALSKSREDCSWSDKTNSQTLVLRDWATLYVQMQLCQRTLRQWLDERNAALPAYPLGANTKEGSVALNLFRKIVRGVEYIHSQGIVHHDIKPSNIFVDKTLKEVQVGDFGLSCCLLSRVDHTGAVGDHHGGVGTRMYAAPEQLRGKCTHKSDIYSLGIVLLELLQPFHTDMERSKVIEKLRAGHLPSEFASSWPHVARLMSDMLVGSAAARPTASELLKRVEALLKVNMESDVSSQLAAKDETIRLLKEAVASRDQEIAELRSRLSVLEKNSSDLPIKYTEV